MFSAEIDSERSLLRLTFTQRVDRDQAAACLERVKALVPSLKPGFCLLTNLSGLDSMELACESFIDQTMDLCNHAGVRKVVRVVPDPNKDIGFGIMSLFHYGQNVRIQTCSTLKEAEALISCPTLAS